MHKKGDKLAVRAGSIIQITDIHESDSFFKFNRELALTRLIRVLEAHAYRGPNYNWWGISGHYIYKDGLSDTRACYYAVKYKVLYY